VTTILDRVPVGRISTEAREVHLGRTLLTIIAAVFFAIGWAAARVFLALAWCGVAVKVGWQEARKPTGGPHGPAR
jgi:hypothetical protein